MTADFLVHRTKGPKLCRFENTEATNGPVQRARACTHVCVTYVITAGPYYTQLYDFWNGLVKSRPLPLLCGNNKRMRYGNHNRTEPISRRELPNNEELLLVTHVIEQHRYF